MEYVMTLLTLALLVVLGLVSFTSGPGPAALKPLQDAVKPGGDAVRSVVGLAGITAVILGVYGVIFVFFRLDALGYAFLAMLLFLLTSLILIVAGTLAGYPSVAAFFGAPASGAGKGIDWVKRTFGSFESIVGLVALVFALWMLIKFILNLSGVHSV